MQLFSQHDPSFDRVALGVNPSLTIHGYGCFLCSLATIYQRSPLDLLKIPGAVTPGGLIEPPVIAEACGGVAEAHTKLAPAGWCIAVTDKYASLGFPTHFFCVNAQTLQQVDPLKFPAVIEPISYHIVEYRPFTMIKFSSPMALDDRSTRAIETLQAAYNNVKTSPDIAMQDIHQACEILRGHA